MSEMSPVMTPDSDICSRKFCENTTIPEHEGHLHEDDVTMKSFLFCVC